MLDPATIFMICSFGVVMTLEMLKVFRDYKKWKNENPNTSIISFIIVEEQVVQKDIPEIVTEAEKIKI
jgi:hypothetical protein